MAAASLCMMGHMAQLRGAARSKAGFRVCSIRCPRTAVVRFMHRRPHVVAMASQDLDTQQLAETAALDQLIDMLLAAKNSDELSRMVAENIMRCL